MYELVVSLVGAWLYWYLASWLITDSCIKKWAEKNGFTSPSVECPNPFCTTPRRAWHRVLRLRVEDHSGKIRRAWVSFGPCVLGVPFAARVECIKWDDDFDALHPL